MRKSIPPQNMPGSALVRITAPTPRSASARRNAEWMASIIA